MIYRLIAFFSVMASVIREANELRRRMQKRQGWMPEVNFS